ncbi:MAG: four helix bundle protein [Elusimicrobia bacterium]|nr:four helix bundle protein [Candidatus Liberimonas magnetica]
MSLEFSFEKLEVYKKSINFVDRIYIVTKCFPKEETFGLTNQIRRASVSIALNIAEGTSRNGKDFTRFLDIAKGSVFECVAIIQISKNQGYIQEKDFLLLKQELDAISRMLSGLKNSVN